LADYVSTRIWFSSGISGKQAYSPDGHAATIPGNNVKLEVSLYYSPKEQRIFLASTDADLHPKDLIITVKPGTAAERQLNALFAKPGKPHC
jgi:hypothetical protein